MAKKQNENTEYLNFRKDLKNGTLKRLYAFSGEERYLLSHYLNELRSRIPAGTEEFNHRRFEGKSLTVQSLAEAIDALPVFSESTLIEIWDYDFSKTSDDVRKELYSILSDIPEYACVVFVFDTVEFKLDARIKVNSSIKKLFTVVEFKTQEKDEIVLWIAKHFKAEGKRIDKGTAEYLSFITGGLMTTLSGEIEKLTAFASGDVITREDVDAVVVPVLDAAAYELTDAMLSGNRNLAMQKLGELLSMNEPPHKILFSIAAKLRQLLCAKVLQSAGRPIGEFMELCSIRYEFQAKSVYNAARKTGLELCRRYVALSSETAYKLNSSPQDGGELLKELLIKMELSPEMV